MKAIKTIEEQITTLRELKIEDHPFVEHPAIQLCAWFRDVCLLFYEADMFDSNEQEQIVRFVREIGPQVVTIVQNKPGSPEELNRFTESLNQTRIHNVRSLQHVLLSCLLNKGAIQETVTEFRTHAAKALKSTKEIQSRLTARSDEIDRTLVEAKQELAASAAAAHATEFQKEARDNARLAGRWMGAVILSGLVAIGITLILFVDWLLNMTLQSIGLPPVPTTGGSFTAHDAQNIVARIALVSVFYFFVIWTARNHAACKHNVTVNNHRRNAMQTFKAFAVAAEDQETRQFILRQAVTCAFSPQQSGYLKDESLPEPPPLLGDVAKVAAARTR